MSRPTIDDELRAELGSIATFLERVADTPKLAPGAVDEIAAADPDLELSERIGAGGAGVVYIARDRRLDREVAVKVQRVSGGDGDQLLAEARALAQLSHPNVVAVHEVRAVDGHMLLIMELVRGPALRRWLETPRDRSEILETFAAAGAGLAAAHRAGLIHRDVKPDNIVVGEDGRVRVVDFGLAGPAGEPAGGGTPAYMAPEQAAGERIDARADQYAFCVSLLEALEDRMLERDQVAAAAGALRPRWLRRAVERGLAADPGDRFADMDALLAALHPPRRWPIAALGLAVALGAAAVFAPRGCAEPVGLMIEGAVADRRAALASYERARRQLAGGHRLRALETLAEVYGRIDDPTLPFELGEAMRGIEPFVRAIDVGDRSAEKLAMRGDGRRLAIAGDGVTALIDLESDRIIAELDGGGPRFFDGGRLLLVSSARALTAVGSDDGGGRRTIEVEKLRELATGGDLIAAVTDVGLQAWAGRTGEPLFERDDGGAPTGGLSVSADGQRVMVARPFVAIYDRAGAELRRGTAMRMDTAGALSPRGQRFALADPTAVRIYATAPGGEPLFALRPARGVDQLRFSAGGHRLATRRGAELCIWDLRSRQNTGCRAGAHHATTADMTRVASSTDRGTVEIWSGETGRVRARLAARRDRAAPAAISDDGQTLATGGTLKLWRGDADTLDAAIERPRGARVIYAGGRLASATPDRLEIRDLDAPGFPAMTLDADTPRGAAVALSDDGSVAAWAGATWSLPGGEKLAAIADWQRGSARALDPAGRRLAICGENLCRMFDARSGRRLWALELAGPMDMKDFPPAAISATPRFGPGGALVLTGMGVDLVIDGDSGAIERRILREGRSLALAAAFLGGGRVAIADGRQIVLARLDGDGTEPIRGRGRGLVAHPDGRRLIVPFAGGAVLADLESGNRLRLDVAGPPGGGVAVSADGALIAVARGVGTIDVVAAATGDRIAERVAGDFIQSLHLSAAGHLVAIAGSRALIWSLVRETRSPAEVAAAIEAASD